MNNVLKSLARHYDMATLLIDALVVSLTSLWCECTKVTTSKSRRARFLILSSLNSSKLN
jgi:hypothetical protein